MLNFRHRLMEIRKQFSSNRGHRLLEFCASEVMTPCSRLSCSGDDFFQKVSPEFPTELTNLCGSQLPKRPSDPRQPVFSSRVVPPTLDGTACVLCRMSGKDMGLAGLHHKRHCGFLLALPWVTRSRETSRVTWNRKAEGPRGRGVAGSSQQLASPCWP